jgi:hypothetical protein
MSHDRQLIDTLKQRFARKSSAQLQEIIVQAVNQDRWSPEAVAAAIEVLQDRKAGFAQEPSAPEEELTPLPAPTVPYSLGFAASLLLPPVVGFLPIFVLNGLRFGSEFVTGEDPDLPVPFGPKMAWLALDSTDGKAVANALDLQGVKATTWAEGIAAASKSSIFITPPLGDWTLAVGAALFPPDRPEALVKPLLERLSRRFGEAQYFCTHREVELHVWARARQGRLVRGYGWLGQKSLTLWDEGRQTQEEHDLGLGSLEEQPPADEESVMELASFWSIAPTTLGVQFKEPEMGWLGTVASADSVRG